jgi:hypothetical protein
MKKLFLVLPLVLLIAIAQGQKLSQVTFSGASTLSYFSFLTDQGVYIRISPEGRIMEYGVEFKSERSNNYYAPKLQPFMGRIEYFGPETTDSIYRGKIKSIGTCNLTYYSSLEKDDKPGKLRSIGMSTLDYYTQFENAALKGKLRFVGTTVLEYYPSLDNEALRGKLKSVGGTPIKYHTTFDDKLIQGKIKSIGSVNYNWGTSLDPVGQKGALKSGSYRQMINGITYILQ